MRKLTTILPHLFVLLGLVADQTAMAQKKDKGGKLVDDRSQAEGWYVPVKAQVFVDGEKAEGVKVTIYRQNERMGETVTAKNGVFRVDLDLDNVYNLLLSKEGAENKLLWIDTTMPKTQVDYPAYDLFIALEPNGKHAGPEGFYTDFPSALIRWDTEQGGFYHSERYLEHIQNKLAVQTAEASR
jgi:hypothetical protein